METAQRAISFARSMRSFYAMFLYKTRSEINVERLFDKGRTFIFGQVYEAIAWFLGFGTRGVLSIQMR
ncbi:hypothetical protein AB0758_49125 [Tolypothrix bouteillei VB521301_2]|uniref:Uncharacterized protein n=1 Tax=Tolypothrix bouteillei VB521301 TaxID=1479485 RepID=A0A0C1R912_9CYAN